MRFLLGIDLGTSSVKCLLADAVGTEHCSTSVPYDIEVPREGCAEQSPEVWWQSTVRCITQLLAKSGASTHDIISVGFSGQMHGTVALDKDGHPVCNSIIHCDARSEKELEQIYTKIDRERVAHIIMNPIYTGFQPASLLWLRNNRPSDYERIRHVVLPKDYIRYRLTGMLGTEVTDAASTTLMEIKSGSWSYELMDALALEHNWFLPIAKPYEVAGTVSQQAAKETGLRAGTTVVYGAGDQPAQALGNGMIAPGMATSNIGTSGQICTPTKTPIFNPKQNTHTFTHAVDNTWYIMGAQLSAGLALKWVTKNILGKHNYDQLDALAQEIAPNEAPIFTPYLMGERTPHMDPNARAVFFGLSLEHDHRHLYRSVMEGVVFSLRDSLETIESLNIAINSIIASGGGAQSDLWMQMQADIFERQIVTTSLQEQANLGAVILAAVGGGIYANLEEACNAMVKPGHKQAVPDRERGKVYQERYHLYRELYPRLRDLYVK